MAWLVVNVKAIPNNTVKHSAGRPPVVEGRVVANRRGYGFVTATGLAEDVYLPRAQMSGLMNGDQVRVMARAMPGGRTEGRVLEITRRACKAVVGRVFREGRRTFVAPRDPRTGDILLPGRAAGKAAAGDWVVCELTRYPDRRSKAEGRVLRILGGKETVEVLSEAAVVEADIPAVWPGAIKKELRGVESVARAAMGEDGRRDLRKLPFVTIDGEHARDFDDAVCARRAGGEHRLLVAIADVSAFVAAGGALDAEARNRGNSVYFPRRVVPMLPEALSNDLCSLRPGEDRLALACDMRVTRRGMVRDFDFYPALIRSRARLTYEQVFSHLAGGPALPPGLRHPLAELNAVFEFLSAARRRRGALDLDIPEAEFDFDEAGMVSAVHAAKRNAAHRLIEECMLAANCCAAAFLSKRASGAVYRVHDAPAADKLDELRRFLAGLGLTLGGGTAPTAGDFSATLGGPQLSAQQRFCVQTVMLRSLAQARYSNGNVGHFALNYAAYAHFTSPIRRYPDLLVHRLIKSLLREENLAVDAEALAADAEHCSMTERRADEATRDVARRLKVRYMENAVGRRFFGVVTGVTKFGLFVELEDILVSGLLHIADLDGRHRFDERHLQLRGDSGARRFRLGDRLEVEVARVAVDEAKIDFVLARGGGKTKTKIRRSRRK